jgi:ribosome-binding protein aMBF1 (putative translation factor)
VNDWISPIGQSAVDANAERLRDPVYRAAWLKLRVSEDIARTIIGGRVAKGWSQARLAHEINTTGSVISRVESGHHKVSVETLRRLANALDVTFTIGPDPI